MGVSFFFFLILKIYPWLLFFSSQQCVKSFECVCVYFVFWKTVFTHCQARCCLSFAPCCYKSLLLLLSFVVLPSDLLQEQRCSWTICFNLKQIAAEGFCRFHLQLEYRTKSLFEIGQNFNSLHLHRTCADKGNLQYWTMAINTRQ